MKATYHLGGEDKTGTVQTFDCRYRLQGCGFAVKYQVDHAGDGTAEQHTISVMGEHDHSSEGAKLKASAGTHIQPLSSPFAPTVKNNPTARVT